MQPALRALRTGRRPCLPATRPAPAATLFPYSPLFRSLRGSLPLLFQLLAALLLALLLAGFDIPLKKAARHYSIILDDSVSMQARDRKSTRLNSSHVKSSYAVFCLKRTTEARPGRQATS